MTVLHPYVAAFCTLDARLWRHTTALASGQHALVTARQLLDAGWSRRGIERAVAAGLLRPVRRGVFLVAGAPPSPRQPLLAACLAAGPRAVASHRAAAWLHGVPDVLPGIVEITLQGSAAPRMEGVVAHKTRNLHPCERVRVDAIPATSAARTIVDLASMYSGFRLARALDHVLRAHRCRLDDVRASFDRVAGRGRAGTTALRRLLEEREEGLKPGDSDLEVRVVRALLRAGLPRPVQGHQVVIGGRVLVLDLAWPPARLGIEVDGFGPHGTGWPSTATASEGWCCSPPGGGSCR